MIDKCDFREASYEHARWWPGPDSQKNSRSFMGVEGVFLCPRAGFWQPAPASRHVPPRPGAESVVAGEGCLLRPGQAAEALRGDTEKHLRCPQVAGREFLASPGWTIDAYVRVKLP